jgi:hypothetical protein
MPNDDIPPWDDEEAQLEYILNQIQGWPLMRPYLSEEERAVEAALRGDLEQFKAFIKTNPQLAQSTRDLIVEFLDCKRSLHNGKTDGKPGRPRDSEEQLRQNTSVHEAAEQFFIIRDILDHDYPKRSKADIKDRAMLLAEELNGVTDAALVKHLKLTKSERINKRRLPYRVLGYEEE